MAALKSKPRVTVCLPVSADAPAPDATLTAIRALEGPEPGIAVSLAGPDETLEAWGRAAADADPRVTFSVRRDPVGLAENLNHLLFHADTELVLCLQPGDRPEPGALAMLTGALDAVPEAVLADGSGPAAPGADAASRLLAILSAAPAGWQPRGLIRTRALAQAWRIRGAVPDTDFAAALARAGPVLQVPQANLAPRPGASVEDWSGHCLRLTEAALEVETGVQETRLLWLAGVTRLLSQGGNAEEREAALEAFLSAMEASERVDVAFRLDSDWDRIRRWTRGFAWGPRARETIADFGPRSVNAREPFNPQPGGGSAIWVETEGRLVPGTRVRLGGRMLETEVALNRATAKVPADVTARAGELPLELVDPAGRARSGRETFWVLRATAFGRAAARALRRMRGLPDPGALKALPAPQEKW